MISGCYAGLHDSVFVLENDRIRRRYAWNGGHLISLSVEDLVRGHGWAFDGNQPDLVLPGDEQLPQREATWATTAVAATSCTPAHLRVEVVASLGTLELKRVFRLYPGCPALACELYLRGVGVEIPLDLTLERLAFARAMDGGEVLDGAVTTHWRATVVAFRDVTDLHNTLVHERAVLPYRFEAQLPGNLLFLDELLYDRGLFVLKEAPGVGAQLHYPGYDFAVRTSEARLVGPGVAGKDLDGEGWTRVYGFVTGITGDGALGRLQALRTYQAQIRLHQPGRDEMVMMNTWGDRSQDTRLGEAFAMAELEAGARLGISHLQLDDGWQWGRSSNSAFEGGSLEAIWSNPDYWQPHPERFPRGLAPVVARGRDLGIEVCLWFNPSKDDGYAHWREDAETLIGLYRDYGIRTFKIDGVQVPDKRAETNLRRMFDTVRAAAEDEVVFNLDVTAGQRYGYHYFNQYGNIFLENRYTDWSNYYPHWTLRNLWMLSRYVPPQNLQIEFLNVWRNADQYPSGDPLAPSQVPFDYAFAITMMAQPLAWFEATGLPEAAFEIAGLVRAYRELQEEIHTGQILPIGEEPSGTGWTGFQSIGAGGRSGYLLIFREYNERASSSLWLWGVADRRLRCRSLLGHGEDVEGIVDAGGRFVFALNRPFTYALYAYDVDR